MKPFRSRDCGVFVLARCSGPAPSVSDEAWCAPQDPGRSPIMNTTDILGGLLQAGMGGRPMGRLEHAMGGGGLSGSGGMLGQILGQLGGGPARGGAPAGTGDILGQLS